MEPNTFPLGLYDYDGISSLTEGDLIPDIKDYQRILVEGAYAVVTFKFEASQFKDIWYCRLVPLKAQIIGHTDLAENEVEVVEDII
jgi:hypothetical protein